MLLCTCFVYATSLWGFSGSYFVIIEVLKMGNSYSTINM